MYTAFKGLAALGPFFVAVYYGIYIFNIIDRVQPVELIIVREVYDNSTPFPCRSNLSHQLLTCRLRFSKEIRQFHPKWFKADKVPILTSLVASPNNDTIFAIFVIKNLTNEQRGVAWQWRLEWSDNTETRCYGILGLTGGDPHHHTLVVKCPFVKVSPHAIVRLEATKNHTSVATYGNFPLCGLPVISDSQPSFRLSACTMVRGWQRNRLPEWIEYHRIIGFEHFVVYGNEDDLTELIRVLRPYLDTNLATLIPFNFNMTLFGSFFFQQAGQMDCIYRLRGRSQWVSLQDVDEFFQIMIPGTNNLADFLDILRENETDLGGVQIPNMWFGKPNYKESDFKPKDSSYFYLKEWRWRTYLPTELGAGHQKAIVRPDNVHYFSVHTITAGGKTVSVSVASTLDDSTKDVRMNHYRDPPGDDNRDLMVPQMIVRDSSLADYYGTAVTKRLRHYQNYYLNCT